MTNFTGAMTATTALMREARGWVEDCEGEDAELLTDSQVRAYIGRAYDGGWPAFLTGNAGEDLLDVARAWIERNPLLGVDPDSEPLAIWTAITTHFTDGIGGFTRFYGDLCQCGEPSGSSEHGYFGHQFHSRDTAPIGATR